MESDVNNDLIVSILTLIILLHLIMRPEKEIVFLNLSQFLSIYFNNNTNNN